MASPAPKPPAFFCPACNQKHRADLSPLTGKAGAAMRTTCQGCGIDLHVHLEDGKPVCRIPPDVPDSTNEETVDASPSRKPPLASGTRIGRYVVEAMVQRGKTSTVYRVEDPETKRPVALKVLGHGATDAARQAFLRQVEVQAKIRHPNILPVYDQGTLDDGRPFFTSEMLEDAETLESVVSRWRAGRIAEDSPLAPLASLEGLVDHVLVPVAEGIYVANVENDVLHGDLTPENILIDGALHRPYVSDFGHASPLHLAAESGEAPLAMKRAITPWTPPEEATGAYHVRTDVWGLGALLAFVLTGEAPLERSRDLARAAAAARYRALPTEAPAALRAIAQKAMSADPDRRYVNARQMAADLRAWRKDGWVRAVDEFGGTEAAKLETRQILQRVGRGSLWVAGGLLVGLLLGSFIEWSGGSGPAPQVTEADETVNRLDQELTRLASTDLVRKLTPAEAARVWSTLDAQASLAERRLEQAPASSARDAVAERIAFVRGRFAPPPMTLEAPEGMKLLARNLGTGETTSLLAGSHVLPPGAYDVTDGVAGLVRFPATIPMLVRNPTRRAEPSAAPIVWRLPEDAGRPVPGTRLVLGDAVVLGEPPYAEPRPPVDVATFRLDRRPLSRGAYLKFLQALPPDARDARLPSTGFELNAERGTVRVEGGSGDTPLVGVSPADAAAYCAWASAEGDWQLRLPTEAEWRLALGRPLPGQDPVRESDRGLTGLAAPALELVTRAGDALAKGKAPDDAAVNGGHPVADDARLADVGFRCVWEPKP